MTAKTASPATKQEEEYVRPALKLARFLLGAKDKEEYNEEVLPAEVINALSIGVIVLSLVAALIVAGGVYYFFF